ncbi:MAG: CBS domain-containing protein [Thermomicrobiales bacterium]
METIQVGDIMSPHVITVPTTMPVEEVARILREQQITGLPVLDDRERCSSASSASATSSPGVVPSPPIS